MAGAEHCRICGIAASRAIIPISLWKYSVGGMKSLVREDYQGKGVGIRIVTVM